jgi:hypothetical protein
MSTGTAAKGGAQIAMPAEVSACRATQRDNLGAVEAVGAAGAGATGTAFGRAGARALAAVEAAAAVAHGRLPAGASAGPGLRPAARRLQIVAGRIAILKPASVGGDAFGCH